jgi:ribokinase
VGAREPRICVVGGANIDLMAKVRRLPAAGETIYAGSFQIDCGGKGSNQAVMAARLGGRVTLVAKLGRDMFGERAFTNYERLGIATSCVFWDPARPSGVASILVDEAGRNSIVYVPGANFALSPDDVRAAREAIRNADVLVCQLEIPVESTVEALCVAKSAGKTTIFNPAPAGPVPPDFLPLCDVVVPNEIEAEALTGLSVDTVEAAAEAARRLRAAGAPAAVVTLGARGALVADPDGTANIPGIPVQAVDTTGAGDVFIGTLAYALGRGETLRRASRLANAAAALSVTQAGTQSSFPSRDEVDRFAARHEVNET